MPKLHGQINRVCMIHYKQYIETICGWLHDITLIYDTDINRDLT